MGDQKKVWEKTPTSYIHKQAASTLSTFIYILYMCSYIEVALSHSIQHGFFQIARGTKTINKWPTFSTHSVAQRNSLTSDTHSQLHTPRNFHRESRSPFSFLQRDEARGRRCAKVAQFPSFPRRFVCGNWRLLTSREADRNGPSEDFSRRARVSRDGKRLITTV